MFDQGSTHQSSSTPSVVTPSRPPGSTRPLDDTSHSDLDKAVEGGGQGRGASNQPPRLVTPIFVPQANHAGGASERLNTTKVAAPMVSLPSPSSLNQLLGAWGSDAFSPMARMSFNDMSYPGTARSMDSNSNVPPYVPPLSSILTSMQRVISLTGILEKAMQVLPHDSESPPQEESLCSSFRQQAEGEPPLKQILVENTQQQASFVQEDKMTNYFHETEKDDDGDQIISSRDLELVDLTCFSNSDQDGQNVDKIMQDLFQKDIEHEDDKIPGVARSTSNVPLCSDDVPSPEEFFKGYTDNQNQATEDHIHHLFLETKKLFPGTSFSSDKLDDKGASAVLLDLFASFQQAKADHPNHTMDSE